MVSSSCEDTRTAIAIRTLVPAIALAIVTQRIVERRSSACSVVIQVLEGNGRGRLAIPRSRDGCSDGPIRRGRIGISCGGRISTIGSYLIGMDKREDPDATCYQQKCESD